MSLPHKPLPLSSWSQSLQTPFFPPAPHSPRIISQTSPPPPPVVLRADGVRFSPNSNSSTSLVLDRPFDLEASSTQGTNCYNILKRRRIPLFSLNRSKSDDTALLRNNESSLRSIEKEKLWLPRHYYGRGSALCFVQVEEHTATSLDRSNDYPVDCVSSFGSQLASFCPSSRPIADTASSSSIVSYYYDHSTPVFSVDNPEVGRFVEHCIYDSPMLLDANFLVNEPSYATCNAQRRLSEDTLFWPHQQGQPLVAVDFTTSPPNPPIPPVHARTTTPIKPTITCDRCKCSKRIFGRRTDLTRHINSVHGGEETYLWCPAPNCLRNHQRPYSKARKDKLREHIRNIHNSDVERRLWPLWFRQVDIAAKS